MKKRKEAEHEAHTWSLEAEDCACNEVLFDGGMFEGKKASG